MRMVKTALMILILGVLAAPALAETQTNETVPLDMVIFDNCTGEEVHITGESHIVAKTSQSANGTFHVKLHVNSKGTAVGLTSGNQYVFSEVYNYKEKFSGAGELLLTETVNFHLISQGSADNLLIHSNLHITVNANGEITTVVSNNRVECQG